MKTITILIVTALAVFLTPYFIPGISVSSFLIALLVAVVLGIVNMVIRPILVVLTFPITILTLGLFVLVINALLFWFVGFLVPGFVVTSFLSAFLGSLVVSVAHWITDAVLD